MLARARHMIAIAPAALAAETPPAPAGLELRIEHEPLGVVLDVAAWNYPLLIPVNVVVPALLAGNVVLLKHSGKTPLCGRALRARVRDAARSRTPSTTSCSTTRTPRALVADPRVDHVAFTGSVRGGHEIQQAATGRFVDVGLELGGKDPAYVAEDADLDAAVAGIVDGACYNAGQSCCAVERVYVHRRHLRRASSRRPRRRCAPTARRSLGRRDDDGPARVDATRRRSRSARSRTRCAATRACSPAAAASIRRPGSSRRRCSRTAPRTR